MMRNLRLWGATAVGTERLLGPGVDHPHSASRVRRGVLSLGIALGLVLVASPPALGQGEAPNVLIYTGTTGFRHADAIEDGIGPIQAGLDAAGIEYDHEDCDGLGGGANNCDNADKNPRIFTSENLAQYDAIFLFNASSSWAGGGLPGPLWNAAERDAIEGFVEAGGGIAANHNAVDMGAGTTSWEWWDGGQNSAVGTLMPGHAATDLENEATVQVSDRNHPSTADLPDSYEFGDEHYNFADNVRGRAHVLATLDEESYEPGGNAMGQDHPISWCKPYDGGRVWLSGMGHFGESYTENGGDNELIGHLVGGIGWAAGAAGAEGDCGGTIWNNFRRTVLSTDLAVGPIGLDIADDGKVYWTEIGPVGLESTGRLKMYDPETDQDTLVGTIETRADHGNLSEDGVLGMALDPGFEENRHVFIYYSPRQPGPPGDEGLEVGHNRISRFTLNEAGTEIVPDSEQPILDVPKVKVGQDGDGVPGQQSSNHPGHVGGAGLTFDSAGDLYLAIGDDVNPFGQGGDGYSQIDQRHPERYDARNTAANTNDLRGKLLRITPMAEASGEPGVGTTYEIPDGNMFAPGTEDTRPEILAMGFRNPFTVQTDPDHPGTAFVADYGPDAGTNDPERGPSGIVEWNHITEPGFYGWPFCTGDNSTENTYFRFEFPDGPSGAQFDCGAESIPNESPNNTGLSEIPGPAVPADVWHKRTGDHPERFGLPTVGSPQEPNVGAVYDYDPDNPSETKWPAYYDGSWLILDRSQNWWREVRLTDDRSEVLRVNGFFQPDQFGEPEHTFPIPLEFGPDGSLYLALWTGGCCRDLSGEPAQLMRIDYIGEAEDTLAPEVEANVSGSQDDDGAYINKATLNLTAEDDFSGVQSIEYSLDGEEFTEFEDPVEFTEEGDYTVTYRATDNAGNTSEEEEISFSVVEIAGCVPTHSDEFDGTALDAERWPVVRNPAESPPTVSGGSLTLPILDEIDGTATGPLSLVAQQVPEGDWTATTKVTIDLDAYESWEQAGLMLWQSDANFVKLVFGRDQGSGARRFEITSDNPDDVRQIGPSVPVGEDFPTTAWIRLSREGNTIGAEFAPDEDGESGEWTPFGGTRPVDTDPPREGEGVLVGPYAGSDIESPYDGTAAFDFFRLSPDELDCPGDGTTPPPPAPPGPSPVLPGPPAEDASVGIDKPKKSQLKLSKLLKGGLKISGECAGVDKGKLKLRVGGKQARRLALKSNLLAKRSVSCKADGTFSAKLKAKGAVKRVLRDYGGKLKAKLVLQMSGPDGKDRDQARVVLK